MRVSSSSRGSREYFTYVLHIRKSTCNSSQINADAEFREILKHHLTKRMYQIVNE